MLLRWSNSLIGAWLTSHVMIIGAWAFHGLRCSLARLFHPEALVSSRSRVRKFCLSGRCRCHSRLHLHMLVLDVCIRVTMMLLVTMDSITLTTPALCFVSSEGMPYLLDKGELGRSPALRSWYMSSTSPMKKIGSLLWFRSWRWHGLCLARSWAWLLRRLAKASAACMLISSALRQLPSEAQVQS